MASNGSADQPDCCAGIGHRPARRFRDAVLFHSVKATKNITQRFSDPLPRLQTPLVRDNGELRPASWDEALDRAAAGFAAIRKDHGGDAFAMFSCSKSTNEMNYAAQKFIRTAMASNNIDSCNRT